MTSRSPVRARQSRLRHAQSVAALLLALASGACDESASEPRHEPSLDEDGDADGDGLTNGVELALGTNLHHVDSDGDGLSDATEVDSVDAPADADGDGFIDALESDQLDNDRDRTPDHQDKADADSWQVAYARFEPSVIANDGDDTTRLEVQIIGATPESVRIGMDSDHWMPHLAPDELSVEGKMLGTDFFELFDDGTHGDAQVHDGIFTRDAISTRMKPRAPITGEKPTSRGEVMLGAIRLRIEGAEQTRQLGYTREPGPQVFRGGLMLRFIEASELRLVTGLGEAAQRTDHTLNVVHTPTALAIHRDLTGAGAPTLIWDNVNLVRPALDLLEKEVDFLYVYPAVPTYGTQAGLHHAITSEASGLGSDTWSASEAWQAGKLKSVVTLDNRRESPILHETMHQWGVYLSPELGFDPTMHWGTAGTYGVLGGFDPSTLVDHGDGTVTVDFFAEWGNDWTLTAFSPIELYLMGFVGPDEVAPIMMLSNAQLQSSSDTSVTVHAEQHTVSIEDIIAAHGPRLPAAADAQKHFEAAFVVFSDHLLTRAELAFIDSRARAIGSEASPDIISFYEASGGRGTLRTELSPSP
jgi:hypothetical protein